MQTTKHNARSAVLAAILAVLLLQTGVAAAVPELAVTPNTVNWTGNQSISANVTHPVNVTFTNQNDSKKIHNVSLPGREWFTWEANHFDLNASTNRTVEARIKRPVAGSVNDTVTVAYRYNQTGLNASEYGRPWQLTFDKNYYPELAVDIDTYYRDTTVELLTLDQTFELELGEPDSSVFKITNTGPETALNLSVVGANMSFDTAGRFNVSSGDDQFIPFTVEILKPETNPAAATNQTYNMDIAVTGRNIDRTTLPVNVTIPYKNYTQVDREEQDINTIVDQFKQFCEQNNCSAVRETVYRNRTVYVNQTPVYDANLTEDQLATLENLSDLQHQNWRGLQERQDLMKNAMNTRLNNVSVELNELEQRNQQETRQLQQAIESLNQTVAEEQRLEAQQQQDSSRLGGMILLLLLVFGVMAVIYYGVTRYMGEDWRLIPQ